MKFSKIASNECAASNDCGGFQEPKGHMDSQRYPECKGKETDRNIKDQPQNKDKKKKKKKSAMSELILKTVVARFGEWVGEKEGGNVWNAWKSKGYFVGQNNPTPDEAIEFNDFMIFLNDYGGEDFIPAESQYDPLRSRIEKITQALKSGQIDTVEASRQYQVTMHEIEQVADTVTPEDYTQQQLDRQQEWETASASLLRKVESQKSKDEKTFNLKSHKSGN